ncbi:DUF2326 domain-containing protein [Niabella beijingensis]|uniref:DUF2326 domain-containing protein n=1 Tax=Niabella beijingensis TaxID=2872700 RepID=UPI001CBE4795|nr:DUF2326 domain-containing protein [Niabella beijingensis]MBZ4191563.1 DUF2326 domain-containing protein [Niabella beijingensis]
MRLIKLSANNPGFKTIEFNRIGLSLIVGKRHNNDYTKNKKDTYNSVGKSLSIALINFCLGSQRNPEFEAKLNDWEFTLQFELSDILFTATRKCSNQGAIYLNNEEKTLKEYTDFLSSRVFEIPENTKYLTFRSLLPRFLRPRKASYNSFDNFIPEEQEFQRTINNAFLLGLDVSLVLKKFNLKDEFDKIEDMRKAFEKDTIIKSFFEQNEDDDFEIDVVDLKVKIQKLEQNLSKFEVAEDYHEVVREADELKLQIKTLDNKAATIKIALSNIEKSLNITPDIPKKRIEQLYKEAMVSLPDAVIKQLADVEEFNKKILDNRSKRLLKEKLSFEKKLSEIVANSKRLGKLKDARLEYLNSKSALDEFTKMNDQLKELKIKLDSIEKYRQLKQEYKTKSEELKREFSLENTKTSNYLESNRLLLENNILIFKSLAEEFYEHKRAGIEVKSNEGVNKNRFEIRAKIDDDKGDGVNDVKIFCFDWTLLLAKHHHKMEFIFHDSRLLSEIDSRQQASLFNVADKKTKENNLQYIISANQNTLDSVKIEMGEEEYNKVIADNIILELTDESEESKLLGIKIDLDYDKE